MTKRVKNKGYTLVEMIIVIAIIAIVAGMSLISITLIHSARAKEASVTVDSEIATLITKSKNMQCDRGAGWQYAARIYADDKGVYYYQTGYYNLSTRTYDFKDTDKNGNGKGKTLTSYVTVKYDTDKAYHFVPFSNTTLTGVEDELALGLPDDWSHELKDLNSGTTHPGGGLFIRFNKDGTCAAGVGTISFYKRNGSEVANIYLRANGSHQIK